MHATLHTCSFSNNIKYRRRLFNLENIITIHTGFLIVCSNQQIDLQAFTKRNGNYHLQCEDLNQIFVITE